MIFNVSGLIQDRIGATREYELEGSIPSLTGETEQVSGAVTLVRTPAGVLVCAEVGLTIDDSCSRCAAPVSNRLSFGFEEEFQATFDGSGQLITDRPEIDAFLIDSQHTLDLTEAVRQYREASASMQPLCRPDCQGLCPRCGSDRNLGDCGCESGVIDARWSGLERLLGEDIEAPRNSSAERMTAGRSRSAAVSEGKE